MASRTGGYKMNEKVSLRLLYVLLKAAASEDRYKIDDVE
jgi:hypothetical protein